MMADVSRLTQASGIHVTAAVPVTGGAICNAWRLQTPDGPRFAKCLPESGALQASPSMFELEAAGLTWLAQAGTTTPEVIVAQPEILVLQWLESAPPSPTTAHSLGVALGRLHSTRAPHFGSPPADSIAESGWLGTLSLPFGAWTSWPEFYVSGRLWPTALLAKSAGHLPDATLRQLERVCNRVLVADSAFVGPEVPPSRIHGDLWSGNVLWTQTGAALIDPAAVGGHPETDLAMLQLFGMPHMSEILRGYEVHASLAPGWQQRTQLHQLLPLLAHCALFGRGYLPRTQAVLAELT